MTPAAATHSSLPANSGWLSRAEAWLDARGKGAWIAAMVLGMIFFWPVGLALLAYMIWSKRMFSKPCRASHRHDRKAAWSAMRPSGNSAFDAYKTETLQRLMDEQQQFEDFLERLRAAKDKTEFDQFMDERSEKARKASDDRDMDASDDR